MEEVEVSKSIEPIVTPVKVHEIAMVRQVIENRKHPLDMVREQISNMCAHEVGAHEVRVTYYVDPIYGASFIFEDDGCGMNYTGHVDNPGRLDRFINAGFSEIVGFKGDEFSWKGLGSKLAFNCRRIDMETWTLDGNGYRVIIEGPYEKLTQEQPELPKAQIYKFPTENFKRSGTSLKVLGYEGGKTDRDYSFDNIKNYLLHRTLIGCTKERELPKCTLQVLNQKEEIPAGYPFIKKDENDWRTVVIEPPIDETEQSADGSEIKVTLKGGFTLDTSKYHLTVKNRNVGIILSVKGIPYLPLDFYQFRGSLNPHEKLCNMVAECDELFETMDLARSDYRREDHKAKAFERALKKAITEFVNRSEYKMYLRNLKKQEVEEKGKVLEWRKKRLMSSEQKFVYITGVDEPIHKEPTNENDVLAIVWKLEGMGKLPFAYFKSLEHTSTRRGGIDIIGHIQEDIACEVKHFVSMEVENEFESFERHGHYPGQTSFVLCWRIADPDILEKAKERYKYFKTIGNHTLYVFEISQFPGILVQRPS